jgi:hypothetical protein
MPTGGHDPHMGTNERRLDMAEKRVRDVATAKAAREARRVVGIWIGSTHGWKRTENTYEWNIPKTACSLDMHERTECGSDKLGALCTLTAALP